MHKPNQILSVSQQDLPRSPASNSISLHNSSHASELSQNTIECLLREADNVQNFRDRVTTMSFQPECSQLEIITDVTVDHSGREQEAWGGESEEGRVRGQRWSLTSFGCHTVYITLGFFFSKESVIIF